VKIAFLHRPNTKFFQPDFFSPYFYNFFYLAFPRNKRIEYTILQREVADVDELNQYDIVILFALHPKLGYVPIPDGCKAMLVANAYDSQYISDVYIRNAVACGVRHFFYHHCPQWFYSFAPNDWEYLQLQMVLEPHYYAKAVPWAKRHKDRVLLTGTMGEKRYYFVRRMLNKQAMELVKHVPRHEMFSRDKYLFL